MDSIAGCEMNGSTRQYVLYNSPASHASALAAGNSGKDDVMPEKRIWRRKVRAESWPCADGKTWSWSIMASAFYMEASAKRYLKTEAEAKADAKWVCDHMGLTIADWRTLKN